MQCSMRHASSDAVPPSTPASQSSRLKNSCFSSVAPARRRPSGGEPHVAACHLDERSGRQPRQGLGDARPCDAQALRDVGVAAEPPLGADDENRLEVVLGGFGRTGVFVPHLINPVLSPKKNLLEKQQTHVVDHTSEQKRGGYVERRRYDGPLRRVDFGPGSRDACRARHIEREREDERERLGG